MKKLFLFMMLFLGFGLSSYAKTSRILLIGEGSMANSEHIDSSGTYGWGQVLATYLHEDVSVINYARRGLSLSSLKRSGHLTTILQDIQRDDIVLIQLGVNESREGDGDSYCPLDQFTEALMEMAESISKSGATPILLTPTAQPYRCNGKWVKTFGGYSKAIHHAARAKNIHGLDMENATRDWLNTLTEGQLSTYFHGVDPEKRQEEYLLTQQGALQIARIAASLMESIKQPALNKLVVINDNAPIRYAEY